MIKKVLFLVVAIGQIGIISAQSLSESPKPSPAQLAWHQLEYYWFAHFGPNTFSGEEWGTGSESASLFNPTNLDTRQWCRLAKQAGAKGIIITAKHHDGFCLWPSRFSTHTVRESQWKNGKGDVLKELSAACKEYGLKFGVYISPWDRNHPDYGTAAYNQVFVQMLKELFTQYGPIWELWWDGANGEGPNGKKQEYDWDLYRKTVQQLSPQTLIFSDVGPHIRWVGNEKGIAGATNWNLLNTEGFEAGLKGPSTDTLRNGNKFGKNWIPAECDVSIRPGWFWKESENKKVKSAEQLFQLYLKSVGRGANLLLNVPPNATGNIAAEDSLALIGFKKLIDANFKSNLLETNGSRIYKTKQETVIQLGKPTRANCISLMENLKNGQHCSQFTIALYDKKDQEISTIKGTTIGAKRIVTFPNLELNKIKLTITEQKGPVNLGKIALYQIEEKLIEIE